MRVALVSQEYPPETAKGGIGTQTYLKAQGLSALGHEVHVLSRTRQKQVSRTADRNVQVTRIPGMDSRTGIYTEIADWLTYSGEVAAALASIHAQTPLDLIDFPEWGAEGFIHLLNRTEWNRIPTVIHLHGPLVMFGHTMGWPEINSEFFKVGTTMEGACVRLADAIFSSSRCSVRWCAEHYGIKPENVPIIHTGVDVEHFRPGKSAPAKRPTIIFAGKLTSNKGVFLLAEAASRLTAEFPDLQLRLLGRGEPQVVEQLKSITASKGRHDLIDFPGFIAPSDLPEHLCRAHVFAAPSEYEGGPGFVYLEAMACGLPVIACAGSGAAEVVREGENGFLVPPGDADALTEVLRTVLRDGERRRRIGEEARRYVLREADSRTCLKTLEAFYLEVSRKFRTKN